MQSYSSYGRPVVIIAAARSGTKLLRKILEASGEFGGCSYDANYVWKNGNYHIPHDELVPGDLNARQVHRVRVFFGNARRRKGADRLLEKTVSNSLRVPLVRRVFPDCQIIHLYRDGVAAAQSASSSWQQPPTSTSLQSSGERWEKIRQFPFVMAWPYLVHYLNAYGRRALLGKKQVDSWGPRYRGIDDDVRKMSLEEVAALQWMKCVEMACQDLSHLNNDYDYINVSYEELILSPSEQLRRITDFIDAKNPNSIIQKGKEIVSPDVVYRQNKNREMVKSDVVFSAMSRGEKALDDLCRKTVRYR